MYKIVVSCGTGIATSTAVRHKIVENLKERGYGPDKVEIGQCRVSDLPTFADNYDLIISTAALPSSIKKPYVLGLAFLTGIGVDKVMDEVVKKIEESGK